MKGKTDELKHSPIYQDLDTDKAPNFVMEQRKKASVITYKNQAGDKVNKAFKQIQYRKIIKQMVFDRLKANWQGKEADLKNLLDTADDATPTTASTVTSKPKPPLISAMKFTIFNAADLPLFKEILEDRKDLVGSYVLCAKSPSGKSVRYNAPASAA